VVDHSVSSADRSGLTRRPGAAAAASWTAAGLQDQRQGKSVDFAVPPHQAQRAYGGAELEYDDDITSHGMGHIAWHSLCSSCDTCCHIGLCERVLLC